MGAWLLIVDFTMQESSKSIQIEAFHVFKVLLQWCCVIEHTFGGDYSWSMQLLMFPCQNSYLLLTKINRPILSAYLLQTKVKCWDYWMNSKLIKVSDAISWIVSFCLYLIKYFSMITCLLRLCRGCTVWSWQSSSDGGNCCSRSLENNNMLELQIVLNEKLQCGILP